MSSETHRSSHILASIMEKLSIALGSSSGSREANRKLMESLARLFDELSSEFNATVADEPLMLTVQRQEDLKRDATGGASKKRRFNRLLVSTAFWTLSVRSSAGTIEFFILPACEIPNLEQGELASRAKLRLCHKLESGWTMDELPVSEAELNTLARSLLKDLIVRSQGDYELLPESTRFVHGGLSLTRSVRSLVAERHALVQKIVNQQESILSQVARDLHDAVLGNVMFVERSLVSNEKLSRDELSKMLSEVSKNLREVCHDIYPRDLKDLGLAVLLEEMCVSFTGKTSVSARFTCVGQIPELTDEVALHVYRIAQECFNNAAKHASAKNVTVDVQVDCGVMTLRIADDGKGFDINSISSKGSGTSIIKERSELINCILPCRISFESNNRGTVVLLEVRYSA